jgi:hypothetical protein
MSQDLEVYSDQIHPLFERLKMIANDLGKDPQYTNTALELLMIAVSLEGVLLGVIQEALEDEDDDDDFVDYGEMTA